MFRQMRRKNQALTQEECEQILNEGKTGIMAVIGDNDYPYTIPLNYIYLNSKIYFHCAKTGHKIDSIKKHDKISFCVIDKDEVVPEKYGTDYRSVVIFGKARIMEEDEFMPVIKAFIKKYCPFDDSVIQKEIDKEIKLLCIVEIKIDHLTGKQAINFVRKR